MCFAYFIDKRNMAGDATLWTKENVDLCFVFLKRFDHLDLLMPC